MKKEYLTFLIVLPLITGTIFGLVGAIYGTEFLFALKCAGMGAIMAVLFGIQGLPVEEKPLLTIHSHRRGVGRKVDYLRNKWKESPVGLVLWISMGTTVGAVLLGGLLFGLVDWAVGVPDPLAQPLFKRSSPGPYDPFVYLLSAVLFAWMVFIPLMDWIDRLDAPKCETSKESSL